MDTPISMKLTAREPVHPLVFSLSKPPLLGRILAMTVVWLVIVVLFTLQLQLATATPLWDAFIHSLSRWRPWIFLTPLIFWLVEKFPLSSTDRLVRNGIIHLGLSMAVGMVAQFMAECLFRPIERRIVPDLLPPRAGEIGPARDSFNIPPGMGRPFPPPKGELPPSGGIPPPPPGRMPPRPAEDATPIMFFISAAALHFPSTMPTYWALLGIQSALLFGAQLRQRERQSLELRAKLTQAQLDTLRLQLQPHFLFNTLNAISTLLHREPKTADAMICHLSTLLRGVLEERGANQIVLARDVELLTAYMSIEQMRFRDRLRYEQHIDAACLAAHVPTLLLQPIAENAVRHGIEPLGRPGTVTLIAQRQGDSLLLRVEDDGMGMNHTRTEGMGIGLTSAKARLEALYGPAGYSFTVAAREGGGTVVTITLPFKTTTG